MARIRIQAKKTRPTGISTATTHERGFKKDLHYQQPSIEPRPISPTFPLFNYVFPSAADLMEHGNNDRIIIGIG